MKLLAFLRTGLLNLYSSIRRFPLTIFLTTATTIFLIVFSRTEPTTETLLRLAMVSALGIPVTLSIALAFERIKSTKATEYGIYIATFICLALYYMFLLPSLNMVSSTRYLALSIALYLTFLFVPYFLKRSGIEMYVIKVLTRFLVTAVYSAVIFAGLAITLLTIDLLLEIQVSFTFYSNVGMVVAGIFAPCFFLAGLPRTNQDMEIETYPTVLKVLLLYIVLPIILIYTFILYVYFLKTLFTWRWPEGTVSHLVLWYSVFSAGVIFLISPLLQENKFVQFFTGWFPKLVLPGIVVMFMAMAVRINAYGVTENRYFVVALGLWVFGVMLYYSLTKRFRNIVLPASLALVALLSVFGPWSAYPVSISSQNTRFEALVSEYNMIDGSSLHKPKEEISLKDKKALVSILEYFDRSHSLSDLRLLPPNFTIDNMEQVFGFSRNDIWGIPDKEGYFRITGMVQSLDIRDYDLLFHSSNLLKEYSIDGLTVQYDPEDMELTVLRGDQVLYARNLQRFAEEVVEKHGTSSLDVPVQDMTFVDDENENIQAKLVFIAIAGTTQPDSGQSTLVTIKDLEFYLLLSAVK